MNSRTDPTLRWQLVGLAAVTALTAWLRLQQAGESLWVDELHTAWCVNGSLTDVAPRAATGNQSPLYFYAVWLVAQVLGASELTLRLISLACGSSLPIALYCVVRHWTATMERETSLLAAFVAAILAALDPLAIFYAQEARPYASVQLVAVGHIYIFSQLLKEPTIRRRALWILSAAALFYLHYTAALLLGAEIVCFAAASRLAKPMSYRPLHFLVDVTLIALLWLPAASQLQDIASRRENWAAFVHPQSAPAIITLFPWAMGGVYVAVGLFIETKPKRPPGRIDTALLCLTWLFVPLSIAWLATRTDVARLFFERYLISALSASYILAALCVPLAPLRSGRFAVAAACALAAIYSSGIVEQLRYDGRVHALRREDWRGAVAYLNAQLPNQRRPVLVRSGLIEADALRDANDAALREYCLYPVTSLYPLDAPATDLIPLPTTNAGKLSREVQQALLAHGGAWLVLRGSKEAMERVERDLQDSFVQSNIQLTIGKPRSFGNVWIVRIEASASSL